MIWTQTNTMFVDAYRELNAKKLFWITMALNFLAVVIFASLGINKTGVSFWHWTFDNPILNTNVVSKRFFYITTFTGTGVTFWLSWVTTILALVSTAGIIPDMISGGTIEAMLSKPIGRVRYFLTKYLSALLFVAMQVGVFTAGAFFVLGIRGSAWEPGIFLAIPIVLAFFSFLYSFCALIGLLTRSTIAALLLTMLFWCMIFIVNMGDALMVSQREGTIIQIEDRQKAIDPQVRFAESKLQLMRNEGKPIPGENGEPLPENASDTLEAVNPTLRRARDRLAESEQAVETWTTWSRRVFLLKTVLPKTQETIGLLERYLVPMDELMELMDRRADDAPIPDEEDVPAMADPRVSARVQEAYRGRTVTWVLGTSLLFEGLILSLCCWIFARRDF